MSSYTKWAEEERKRRAIQSGRVEQRKREIQRGNEKIYIKAGTIYQYIDLDVWEGGNLPKDYALVEIKVEGVAVGELRVHKDLLRQWIKFPSEAG